MLLEDIYYDFTNGQTIRGWPLVTHFNKLVLEVAQSGLLNKWEYDVHTLLLGYFFYSNG